MKQLFSALYIISTCLFFSCGGGSESKEAVNETHQEVEKENPNGTSFTQDQMESIGVEIAGVEEKQLTASLKASGVLQVPNQNKASVNSIYRGVIRSLLIQPGNVVAKGQVIATIANPDFIQAQEEYLNVNSQMILAEQEYNRQKELNQGNAGALKNLQAAEANLKTLRTRKSALQQQISLMGIDPGSLSNEKLISVLSLRSPIGGVVSNVSVKIGEYVDVTTPVAAIVDNSQLHLDLFVYEQDLSKLKNNQLIHFTLTNNPVKEYDATIYSLGSSFEGASKAVTVHALVKGDKTGLIDGMNITAVISLEKNTVPALPSEAIVSHEGKDYVFLVTEESNAAKDVFFERIPIAKGTSDVGYTEVTFLKEVPKDAKFVVKGAFFVLAKMTNSGEEGGHGH